MTTALRGQQYDKNSSPLASFHKSCIANRPSVALPLLTNGYNWAKTNVPCKIIQDDDVSTTVEVCSQVAQCQKRVAKDAFVVSESSSAIITSSQSAADVTAPLSTKRGRKRKAVTVSSSESANRIDIVVESQSQSLAADVTEPLSTKRGRKRKAVTMPSSGPKTATVSPSESANRIDKVIESPSQSSAGAADVTERKAAAVSESFSQSSAKDTNLADVENFEMYKRTFSKWTVKISKKDATYESRCNCPAYLKEYLCKHIIGLGMRFKLISVPPEAKNVPIGQKRKRGRPSKTKPALMLQ